MGMTEEQKESFLKIIMTGTQTRIQEFHHGDCIGSDKQAHDMVKSLGDISIHVHPPLNPEKRAFCNGGTIHKPKQYLERNKDIVDSSDILIATPMSFKEEIRSGTWNTVRYARRKFKPVFVIYPDGKICS